MPSINQTENKTKEREICQLHMNKHAVQQL
jgi:hypothetical protein